MVVLAMNIRCNSTCHLEKATCYPPKPTPLSTPLECQKSLTCKWDADKHIIRRNGVQKPISQISGLKDLRTIPATLTEILENKNYEYKSKQKHISIEDKLKEKYEFCQNIIKINETILQIIDEGHILPVIKTPSNATFSNNKFTLTNFAFVQEAMRICFYQEL